MKERFEGGDGKRRLIETLQQQRLVEHDANLAEMLADCGELIEFRPGEMLCQQDAVDNHVLFMLTGVASVFVNDRFVAERTHKEAVGEMAALDATATRSATVRAKSTIVALRVDEPKCLPIFDKFPRVWKAIALILGERLRKRSKFHRSPNPTPILFLGCSVEGLAIAKAIQLGLKHAKFEVRIWTNGVFSASGITANDLLKQAEEVDFGLFVFGPDDKIASRTKEYEVPRDNVIFEIGVFMGRLGRERTYMVMQHGADLNIPSDLLGITPMTFMPHADLTMQMSTTCTEIENIVRKLGVR